jgi:2-hydroxychromene-2-carboxylate isomerase
MQLARSAPVRTIEVFADVLCPFTHVGLRRLVAERDRVGRNDRIVRVRAWPLELVNRAPLAADFVAEEVAALRESVAPDLFAGFNPDHFPSTSLPALGLTAAGYFHNARTGEQLSLALRTALFEEGRDIADPTEFAAIAALFGVALPGRDAIRAIRDDWEAGIGRGVQGSPYFFVGHHDYFCPTLNIQRVNGHLHVAADHEAFERFMHDCFDRHDATP